MKLLVIDDEYYIVQGIVKAIDCEELNIDQVFTAYSAKQGRAVLQNNPIDLLLVDVEMPQETGLELLEWMRQNRYRTTTLILSGHQRFDYAQTAILYHCFNYLLKPISKATLNPDYLSYCFHKYFGKTLIAYLTDTRIDHAKYLLRNSKLSVSDISEQCGFSNVPYFYKQFKKVTGITPQQYKE